MINECSKLAQEECKTRLDWVGKMIHRELYVNLTMLPNGIYTKKPVQENKMQNIFWKFETQTDHLIPEENTER